MYKSKLFTEEEFGLNMPSEKPEFYRFLKQYVAWPTREIGVILYPHLSWRIKCRREWLVVIRVRGRE